MDHAKAVLLAAEQGNQQAISSFLEGGTADVCDEEESTPLMYAAANGKETVIRLLLRKEHATPNAKNVYGWTALMQAACYGHLGSVLLLLQGGAEVNAKTCLGTTALVGAAQGGFSTIVQHLLTHGAAVNHTGGGAYALTPLMAAAQCGHMLILGELLKHGSEINARFEPIGWTALMLAVLNNQLEAVKLLLRHGADPKLKDANEQDAAQLAKSLGYSQMASLLSDCTEIEFFELVKQGSVDGVRNMLSSKQEWASIRDKDGATPLMHAANKGYKEICEVLVAAGAELNARDNVHGWTALMQATHQRRHAIVELLCKGGADTAIRGKNGTTTVLDIADKIGDLQILQLIGVAKREELERGGKPFATNKKMLLDLKGLHVPSDGDPNVPTLLVSLKTPVGCLESPRTPVGGSKTPVAGLESPRTPVGGSKTPVAGLEYPTTPTDDAFWTPMVDSPLSIPPANAPRIPLAWTPMAGTPLMPLASAPRVPLAGAPRTPLFGASPTTPTVLTPQAQRGLAIGNALDPHALAVRLQNALKPTDVRVFPDASPPQSPEQDCLQPRFPKSSPYSAPTSLSSSLEGQQLAASIPPNTKSPFPPPKHMPPRVQGGGALGKLLAGGALVPAPKNNILGKNNGRLSQGLGRAAGSLSPKQELPSLQKYSPSRAPLPLHVPRQRQQQPLNKASMVVAPKAGGGGVPRYPTPAHGGGPGVTMESPVLSRERNLTPDLCAILAKHSLEHHFQLFSEQEVDYHSFLSLSVRDLRELGVCDEEEQLKLLELIELLNKGEGAIKPTNADAPVFVFQ